MPTSLGPAEILVILIVALIVLGPKRLPEAGRQVGKAITEVRKWSQGFQDEIRNVVDPNNSPPSYAQPQPGYQPPIPMVPAETSTADDASPPPGETVGTVTTGSHGLVSGPTTDVPSTGAFSTEASFTEALSTEASVTDASSTEASSDETASPDPAPPSAPPSGELPRT